MILKTSLIISIVLFSIASLLAKSAPTLKLSDSAKISVLTCSQGALLYESFGHSAIRVQDPVNNIDVVFNYGIFSFNENFYLNFAKGLLWYKLGLQSYQQFLRGYVPDNRSVTEQVLNLSNTETQIVFNALDSNYQPENRKYKYDYFRNNCATKITAILSQALKDSIIYEANPSIEQHSYRSLIEKYAQNNRWGKLGIDLCLGAPIDKKLNNREYEFMPDYLKNSLDSAFVIKNGEKIPLVKHTFNIHKGTQILSPSAINGPRWFFWVLFLILSIFAFWAYKNAYYLKSFDIILFGISGLIGLLLLILWVATDHYDARNNYNLLWAFPLNLIVSALVIFKPHSKTLIYYYFFMGAILTALVLFWTFLPQKMNPAFFPVVLILLYRCGINCYRYIYHLGIVKSI